MPDLAKLPLLTVVTFMPLVGALILMLFFKRPPDEEDAHGHAHAPAGSGHGQDTQNEHVEEHIETTPAQTSSAAQSVRVFALGWTFLVFVFSLLMFAGFDRGKQGFQFIEGPWTWVADYKVNFHLGVDGISLLLILLTTFLSVLSVYFSFNIKRRIKEYMVFLMILQTAMTGVFASLDLVLFYVFWEAVLIPMYFLIGIWGHDNRIYAAVKFFLYTFAGSVLMLVGIVYIYTYTHSFSLIGLLDPNASPRNLLDRLDPRTLMYLYSTFALAFMIKVPMFPFHTWLPDAHVEAPTAGSVILAGIMLKMGTYGFLRFCLPIFPQQARDSAPLFITLAVIGIIYGAVVAIMQPDMKKLVAYSSVSHLGFVMLGIFSFTTLGITGAILQSINHGISTGMLFFLVGMLYERRHTREIRAFGGLKRAVPILSTFFLIALLSSVALPLTNGFVGEFTILQGSFLSEYSGFVSHAAGQPVSWFEEHLATALSSLGMVLSAIYMLWLFQRVFTGPVDKAENRRMPDLSMREKMVLAPLVVLVFWFGCYVTTWTNYLNTPVATLMQGVSNKPTAVVEKKVPASARIQGATSATRTAQREG